ncbi:MAG: branched-chain amino acid ABC transporter permease [Actinomycetota bacterium]|nr:branched-chain amino acid ABC transporter permease [Actinomycetota bacterium]
MNTLRIVKWASLAAVAGLTIALPYVVSSFYVNMATQMLFFGLFALSINLIAGYGGMVTLGQAGVLGIAGYGLGIFYTSYELPLATSALLAIISTIVVALFFGLLLVRASGVYFLMITLAQGMVVWGVAQRLTTLTGGDNGLRGIDRPLFAFEYWSYYYFSLAVVALCVFLIARIVRSPFGLSLKGVREAETRMAPLGYDVKRIKLIAFTISGTFAGVAGLLLAMYNNFFSPPSVYVKASAEGLLMSILGGVGTITGAFVGSGVFVFVTNYISGYVERWPTLLGLIFVLTILFTPDGVVGAWQRLVWARLLRRFGAAHEAELIEVGVGGGGLLSDRERKASRSTTDADSAAPEHPAETVEESSTKA